MEKRTTQEQDSSSRYSDVMIKESTEAQAAPMPAETNKVAASEPSKASAPKTHRKNYGITLRRLTFTAMFVALAVGVKSLTLFTLSVFGPSGIRISFAGVFTFFPAILFGPVYGGLASAMSDLLGVLIAPSGPYIPWLTVMAFAGGFLKGVLWRVLKKQFTRKAQILSAVALILVGTCGIAGNLCLIKDEILQPGTIVANQKKLPSAGQVAKANLSPLSRFLTGLAGYNKDTYTLTSVLLSEGETQVTLPSKLTVGGITGNVTKIGDNALAGLPDGCELYIPAGIKTISSKAFGDQIPANITILSSEGSAAALFASENRLTFHAADVPKENKILTDETTFLTCEIDGMGFKSSDTYRKYLAGYINLAVGGAELVMVLGLLFLLLSWLIGFFGAKKGKDQENSYWRIAVAVMLSGLFVTTVNTWILQTFLPAWQGRAFLILWIPRLAEELVVCLIQAYLISLLYGVILNTKLKDALARLTR